MNESNNRQTYHKYSWFVAVSNVNDNLSFVSTSSHEEVDTEILLHAKDAACSGFQNISIRAVDIHFVITLIGSFSNLNIEQLWVSFGAGKYLHHSPFIRWLMFCGKKDHKVYPYSMLSLGVARCHFLLEEDIKISFKTWKQCEVLTSVLLTLTRFPSLKEIEASLSIIERFAVLMCDQTSTIFNVNQSRKDLLARKARKLEGIPPMQHDLTLHLKRAVYFNRINFRGD